MKLQFADKIIHINEQEKDSIISISTGKQLYTYNFDINIIGKRNLVEFQQLVDKYSKENLNELSSDNNVIRKFLITKSNYSYIGTNNDEDTHYHYTLEISEQEELSTSILTIADVICNVLSYNEEIDKKTNAIIINAVIKQTEEDRKTITSRIAENAYFDVVRNDISSKVLKMRYGKTIWSKHDGFIKRKVVLVQEKYDEDEHKSFRINEPELTNIKKLLAYQIKYTALLENLLIKKGILSIEEITEIKSQVEEKYKENFIDYYLVEDAENDD